MLTLQTTATDQTNPAPAVERRECRRTGKQGRVVLNGKGVDLADSSLLECTTQGARVIVSSQLRLHQRLDFRLTTGKGRLQGYARVAWTLPVPNGSHVAGLEFIDFTISTARTDLRS